ncbi:hypothetical protein FN846DRAFT_12081 [Sphaerosporella brunnea]|uniref:Uncharacterized protein n=1 Tax=Sphaerosporella brunnea TaxID=1250544 RepID=A0A5J5EWX9_9PEZI|nr:hypothetical protein FN846DRAFT_12081 [Sphaerosporella brunnea]
MNFDGRVFIFAVFCCAGQSENPELGARPPEGEWTQLGSETSSSSSKSSGDSASDSDSDTLLGSDAETDAETESEDFDSLRVDFKLQATCGHCAFKNPYPPQPDKPRLFQRSSLGVLSASTARVSSRHSSVFPQVLVLRVLHPVAYRVFPGVLSAFSQHTSGFSLYKASSFIISNATQQQTLCKPRCFGRWLHESKKDPQAAKAHPQVTKLPLPNTLHALPAGR